MRYGFIVPAKSLIRRPDVVVASRVQWIRFNGSGKHFKRKLITVARLSDHSDQIETVNMLRRARKDLLTQSFGLCPVALSILPPRFVDQIGYDRLPICCATLRNSPRNSGLCLPIARRSFRFTPDPSDLSKTSSINGLNNITFDLAYSSRQPSLFHYVLCSSALGHWRAFPLNNEMARLRFPKVLEPRWR